MSVVIVPTSTILNHGDLGKRTMYIHPNRSHLLTPLTKIKEPPGGHDKNGFALAAQSGQSQGRPSTNTSSQLSV